ncbi:MAG: hypothetical protein ACJ75S_08580 [Solirubrobacterales bacterium]
MDDRVTQEPRTSKDKIGEALAVATELAPTDQRTARLQQAMSVMMPMVQRLGVVPEDPAELDELLLKGARLALAMRSDDAELPETIAELLGPEPAINAEAEEVPAP